MRESDIRHSFQHTESDFQSVARKEVACKTMEQQSYPRNVESCCTSTELLYCIEHLYDMNMIVLTRESIKVVHKWVTHISVK